MKMFDEPQNVAVISNVAEVGEFRIRNSAKAFKILSAGLYANKIRAIIRELTTNALDSHTAAGTTRAVDVHLPSSLEPRFSVRDYGTGLDHDEVTNIYTTYFESTKTNSNDFVGALGLGSKTPFSYTDNFTVTAIKDGVQRIYSAYLNDHGVPSIALMCESNTNEPNGVEVEFAVISQADFGKFRNEAAEVYSWFKTVPNVKSVVDFSVVTREYEAKDIIPGVHQLKYRGYHGVTSYAVMGNIAYPIEIPSTEYNESNRALFEMLRCGLVLEFPIGALDFQPSREGLSYIKQTVTAIERRLSELRASLNSVLSTEAGAITCQWALTDFLESKLSNPLWKSATVQYLVDTKHPAFEVNSYHSRVKAIELDAQALADKFNIKVTRFAAQRGNGAGMCSPINPTRYEENKKTFSVHKFTVGGSNARFVIDDTKTGGIEATKRYYRKTGAPSNLYVTVISPADRKQTMDVDGFFKLLLDPPEKLRLKVTDIADDDVARAQNVTLLSLQRRGGNGGWNAREDRVWRDAGKLDTFDSKRTYYYFNLSGYTVVSKFGSIEVQGVWEALQALSAELGVTQVYGVRKADHKAVAALKNWVCLDDYIPQALEKAASKLKDNLVRSALYTKYGHMVTSEHRGVLAMLPEGYLRELIADLGVKESDNQNSSSSIAYLVNTFKNKKNGQSLADQVNARIAEVTADLDRYGMLWRIKSVHNAWTAIQTYVKMVDGIIETERKSKELAMAA